jgi:hypothetical protein
VTYAEAGKVRACINCGAPGAWLCRSTRGTHPNRLLRVCHACLRSGDWHEFGLVERPPMPELYEDPDTEAA